MPPAATSRSSSRSMESPSRTSRPPEATAVRLPAVGCLATLKGTEPIDEVVAALQEDGAVVIEEMVEPGLLDRFNAELDPLLAAARPDHDRSFVNDAIASFFGEHTRHVTGVASKSRVFAAE